MEKFRELGLDGDILKGIADLGFETPSPVQEKAIPVILGEENDLVVLAQTGTGKTAAFGLPLLQKINPEWNNVQILVLSPTRELCMQIGNDLKNYSKYLPDIRVTCVYGGTDIRRQMKELQKGVHVVVATPGRLVDLLNRKALNIETVFAVVLDEADEMLNMGFQEDLDFILSNTPKDKNTYLFSATMPKEVERIARNYLVNQKEIAVGKKNQGADTVSHQYYMVRAKDCYETLRRIVDCAPSMYAIIFTRTKNDAQDIAKHLQRDGIDCDALHGDLSQAQRDNVMNAFRAKRLKVLVATDVAARGLDVDCLTHVINYNLPEDVESYTHRSGRTGRAGKEGISIAIIHSKEKGKLRRIEGILKKKFEYKQVPVGEEICRAQLMFYADKILASEDQEDVDLYAPDVYEKFAELSKEELIQHLVSYEFGKLLKKYKNTADLNIGEDDRGGRSERGERGDRRDRRGRGEDTVYSTFMLNVGREDGLTPRDLMGLINKYSRRRGIGVGGIRIFDTDTKFEIDEESASDFAVDFSKVLFNGIPLEIKAISTRDKGRRRDDRSRGESAGRRERRDRDKRDSRGGGRREEKSGGKRRGRPGSDPKKPRNFNRSSSRN
ncbi:MAG TPA: DEAD/DEAH box helicase [Candidatus Butyricimonas faecavium]|nr:DEAD/DEAH box helicase [Candidatus Butyricimonas faecavium]